MCFVCLSHMVALCCWMCQEVFAQLRLQLPAPNPSPRRDVAEQAAGSDGSVGPQTASLLQEALLNVMGKPSTRELVVVERSWLGECHAARGKFGIVLIRPLSKIVAKHKL